MNPCDGLASTNQETQMTTTVDPGAEPEVTPSQIPQPSNVVSFKTKKPLTDVEIANAAAKQTGAPKITTMILPGQLHPMAPSLGNEQRRFKPDALVSIGHPMLKDHFMGPMVEKLATYGYQPDLHWREFETIFLCLDSILFREWGYKTPYHQELEDDFEVIPTEQSQELSQTAQEETAE